MGMGETPPKRPRDRDYEALWQTRYKKMLRQGMSEHMARYVATREVHQQMLADRGLAHLGAGDLELVY
jgi:hypothetical protein